MTKPCGNCSGRGYTMTTTGGYDQNGRPCVDTVTETCMSCGGIGEVAE